jgi:hypothetical protein
MLAFLNGWDVAILLLAGYLAIVLLVRLMRKRRDELVRELQQEVTLEQFKQKAERRRQRKQQIRERQIRSQLSDQPERAPQP